MASGTLFIVATPIGNLQDITLRAIETLKAVDAIFCEDTRVTAKLLAHLGVTKPLFAYHQHSSDAVVAQIASTLREGMQVALVSDAGTPGINDPGGALIARLLAAEPGLAVVPIPGPNAAVTTLSVSGFPADRFQYWGFIPHKKGRQTLFRELALCEDTVVLYESKHRILKTLGEMQAAFAAAGTPDRPVVLGRELTKQFETLYRGTVEQVATALQNDEVLGEFVLIVGPKGWR
ncbi:MAG: 16S rRNA (cytidine(1402)-2'-O)-methyltransferase [Candidatus Yanofskybacteria bacterium]|nr:16S rRNA (cytidine(1402)-2'-O)-methyltransferase [Candidatus Yanofskybacteria bacterium]